jgi:hypothetical protein
VTRRDRTVCFCLPNKWIPNYHRAAIIALFRIINRYVGNLPPMPGVFPDYPAPVIRDSDAGLEMVMMR